MCPRLQATRQASRTFLFKCNGMGVASKVMGEHNSSFVMAICMAYPTGTTSFDIMFYPLRKCRDVTTSCTGSFPPTCCTCCNSLFWGNITLLFCHNRLLRQILPHRTCVGWNRATPTIGPEPASRVGTIFGCHLKQHPLAVFNHLVSSKRRRRPACVIADDGHTRYWLC